MIITIDNKDYIIDENNEDELFKHIKYSNAPSQFNEMVRKYFDITNKGLLLHHPTSSNENYMLKKYYLIVGYDKYISTFCKFIEKNICNFGKYFTPHGILNLSIILPIDEINKSIEFFYKNKKYNFLLDFIIGENMENYGWRDIKDYYYNEIYLAALNEDSRCILESYKVLKNLRR